MGFLSRVKTVCNKVVKVATSRTAAFIAAGTAFFSGIAAHAQDADVATYEVVKKGTDGSIQFQPEKLVTPVVDGMISGYQAWAVIIIIIVVVGILVWIVKKK